MIPRRSDEATSALGTRVMTTGRFCFCGGQPGWVSRCRDEKSNDSLPSKSICATKSKYRRQCRVVEGPHISRSSHPKAVTILLTATNNLMSLEICLGKTRRQQCHTTTYGSFQMGKRWPRARHQQAGRGGAQHHLRGRPLRKPPLKGTLLAATARVKASGQLGWNSPNNNAAESLRYRYTAFSAPNPPLAANADPSVDFHDSVRAFVGSGDIGMVRSAVIKGPRGIPNRRLQRDLTSGIHIIRSTSIYYPDCA